MSSIGRVVVFDDDCINHIQQFDAKVQHDDKNTIQQSTKGYSNVGHFEENVALQIKMVRFQQRPVGL